MGEPSNNSPIYLLWEEIAFDSAPWDPNRKIEFFVDPPSSSPERVTSLDEKALVRWLMRCEQARALIFRKLGRQPTALYATEVTEPFYRHDEGDVDIVLCDRLDPEAAVALECKRIKVEGLGTNNDHMNKLPDVALAVQQANKLHEKCGFLETYLALLIAVDSAAQLDSNIPCRGLRPDSTHDFGEHKTQKAILDFPGRQDLNPEIGIIFIEVVQPSGKPIDEMANVRVLLFHPARPRFQSARTTNEMAALIEKATTGTAPADPSIDGVIGTIGGMGLPLGDGAEVSGVGVSCSISGAAPTSTTTIFHVCNWRTVIRRSVRSQH
jgi:hypothetical protein